MCVPCFKTIVANLFALKWYRVDNYNFGTPWTKGYFRLYNWGTLDFPLPFPLLPHSLLPPSQPNPNQPPLPYLLLPQPLLHQTPPPSLPPGQVLTMKTMALRSFFRSIKS